MTDPQIVALRAAARGEQPAIAVARALDMLGRNETQRTASRTVKQLINRGLLARKSGEYWVVVITDAGREALQAALDVLARERGRRHA